MHTLKIIAGGLVVLGAFLIIARFLPGIHRRAVIAAFIPVWLVLSVINLWIGVSRAGYSVREEAPVLLVVFAVPAAVAALLLWRS
jgi:hypothetical protein